MKKIAFLFALLFFVLLGTGVYANTYEEILKENGYTNIHNNYIDKAQLKEVLGIIFKADITFNAEGAGHSTGRDFFAMVEDELGIKKFKSAKKEAYLSRALTFAGLFELLDFYFEDISELYAMESYYGKLSKSESGYTLTYGEGVVCKFSEFSYFNAKEKLYDVNVIIRDNKIIDVCLVDYNAPLSAMYNKKELAGRIYLLYDKGIIIESDGELYEYPIASSFKVFGKGEGEDVVLILGSYKKNKNMAAIAIGRT